MTPRKSVIVKRDGIAIVEVVFQGIPASIVCEHRTWNGVVPGCAECLRKVDRGEARRCVLMLGRKP